MKIAIINTYSNGSTGSIASLIAEYALQDKNSVKMFYGRNKTCDANWNYIGESKFQLFFSNAMTYVTGNVGSFHNSSTKKLIKELDAFKPDIIHLHNIHGNYLNFKMLFKYLGGFNGKVVITLHDEFLLTGRCALCACEKWEKGCYRCKHLNAYPHALIDRCTKLQNNKIAMLKSIKDLTIVTPSHWLEQYVKKSMISFTKCECIHNGVPNINCDDFDATSLIENNKINILFAAFTWTNDKGLSVINELANSIDMDKYNIVVAGVDQKNSDLFDKKCRTVGLLSKTQLFSLLQKSTLFVNPTYKDNFPTILIESLKAGTPVITFDTGGCGEIIDDTCGVLLKDKTCSSLLKAIENFDYSKHTKNACIKRSDKFSSYEMAKQYLEIYKSGSRG